MNRTDLCPDPHTLRRFLHGDIAADVAVALEEHLPSCSTCLRVLGELSEFDTASNTSHVVTPGPEVQDDLRQLVERLRALPAALAQQEAAAAGVPLTVPSVMSPPAEFLGRYRILHRLGEGGMGRVFLAEDPEFRRRVAVKVPQFNGSPAEQQQARQRFLREARAAAAVRHPNICPVYDLGEERGTPFVVMPFVEGGSLAQRLSGQPCVLTPRAAVTLVLRVAEALHAVHVQGIVHRDLKPGNILLDRDGQPLLADFGLARAPDGSEAVTAQGSIVGTPAYMAPEQARGGTAGLNPRTDIYSLGVVLYQLLTGRLPLEGPPLTVLGLLSAGVDIVPPRTLRPELDPQLSALVETALAHDPDQRFADAHAFAAALAKWLATAATPTSRSHTPRLRHWRRIGAGLAAALALVALLCTLTPSFKPPGSPKGRARLGQYIDARIGLATEPGTPLVRVSQISA